MPTGCVIRRHGLMPLTKYRQSEKRVVFVARPNARKRKPQQFLTFPESSPTLFPENGFNLLQLLLLLLLLLLLSSFRTTTYGNLFI